MAGRPKGSPNKGKPFQIALRMELAAAGEEHKALRTIAKGLIAKASQGDLIAIKEIADRLDGKPTKSVEVTGDLWISHEEALESLA
jgi:hypothetical protein